MVAYKALISSLAAAGAMAASSDVPSLQIKGSKFFYPNGTQFIIRGIAYQHGVSAGGSDAPSSNATFTDSLVSESNCKRDIPNLIALNTNLIRTYGVDPDGDHDACMQMLAEAGIYVIADMGNPTISINREAPQWDLKHFDFFKRVADKMSKYPNVVGFFVGNEVTNSNTTTGASAYVKAAVRDMKKYVKDNKYHTGIGYAADDSSHLRDTIAQYMNCGDESESIDFYGYNVYEWCGDSSFQKSGYNRIIDFFKDYSVPAFFAEYGCNQVKGGAAARKWQETTALYADNMTAALSGGIVYEYFEEKNDYGLVKASDGDSSVTKLDDFSALEEVMKDIDPKGVSMSSYSPDNKASSCPSVDATWEADASTLPPTPNNAACECAANASTCVPVKSLDTSAYEAIFNYTCGQGACDDITGNPAKGKYGAFSMCSDEQKLAIVLGVYHAKHSDQGDSCSFGGNATTQKGSGKKDCAKQVDNTGNGGGGNSGNDENAGVRVGAAVASLATIVALVVSGMVAI